MLGQNLLIVYKAFKTRFVFIVISFFLLLTFAWTISPEKGFLYYSIIATLCYLPTVYNDFWHIGRKDKARPISLLQGLLLSVLTEGIGAILLLLTAAAKLTGWGYEVLKMAFFVWIMPFWGFFEGGGLFQTGDTRLWRILLLISIVPVTSFLGYTAGLFDITVLDKLLPRLIYKNPDKKGDK